MACRIARAATWAVRLSHESYDWDKSVFVTLTYNNENYPADGMLNKNELQKFIKRLRRRISGEIKYYATGEYGNELPKGSDGSGAPGRPSGAPASNGRPHYHLIIYGLGIKDHKCYKYKNVWACIGGPIYEAWKNSDGATMGFVWLGTVTYDSCRYTAEYIQKKLYYKMGNKCQPFSIMSKGLGKGYVDRNLKKFEETLTIIYQGKKVAIPPYYITYLSRKTGVPKEVYTKRLLAKAEEKRKKKGDKLYEMLGDNELVYADIVDNRIGSERRLKKRQEIFNR